MAKRLIDANELDNKLRDYEFSMLCPLDEVDDVIDCCHTVDAVEVIRCNNCKNWMYEFEDIGLCVADAPDIDGVQRCANDFCSYGERRDEA